MKCLNSRTLGCHCLAPAPELGLHPEEAFSSGVSSPIGAATPCACHKVAPSSHRPPTDRSHAFMPAQTFNQVIPELPQYKLGCLVLTPSSRHEHGLHGRRTTAL